MKTKSILIMFMLQSIMLLSNNNTKKALMVDTLKLPTTTSGMNNKILDGIIKKHCIVITSQLGYWEVKYYGYNITIITDEKHNRMRIVSPVIEAKKLNKKDLETLLSANFDKALDAKYALYKEYLWTVFSHPLNQLEEEQFINALQQVATLVANYGSTYTSTDLIFGGDK